MNVRWRWTLSVKPDRCPKEDSPELIRAIGDTLTDKEPTIRVQAARILGKAGSSSAVVLPSLIAAADDESPLVRGQVYFTIGRIGAGAKEAIPVLVRGLGEKDDSLAGRAAFALEDFGPLAVPALTSALKSENSQVLKAASLALSGIDRRRRTPYSSLKPFFVIRNRRSQKLQREPLRLLSKGDRMMQAFTRRQMLQSVGGGLGMLALADLLNAAPATPRAAHFAPKAKRIIHLFMNGGPFQCDLFDPKPDLNRLAGTKPPGADLRTERPTGALMAVPFKFAKRGQSGVEVSDLLPQTAQCIDDICVLRSLYTDNPNHGPALFMMNNGTLTPNRHACAWLSYGLGTENTNLPGFVVLCWRPVRFAELWSSGFLPASIRVLM